MIGELVRQAVESGWNVRATWFERTPTAAGAEWMRADLRDPAAAQRAAAGVDAVIHTAYRQGDGEWETNVAGTAATMAMKTPVRELDRAGLTGDWRGGGDGRGGSALMRVILGGAHTDPASSRTLQNA